MSSIVVATARDEVRAETILPLTREGWPIRGVSDWAGLCEALAESGTRLVIVDPKLPDLRPDLAAALAASLPHRPVLRVLGASLPPLTRVHATSRAVERLARQVTGAHGLDPVERRVLRWMGLGETAMADLARLAAAALPILVHGERGTGKERVARALQALLRGPLVVLPAFQKWEPGDERGTLFLESAHRREDIRAIASQAEERGWRVIAGTRHDEPIPGLEWARVTLSPLRERPDDLRQLTQHYLDSHARRMGLPRRAFDRGMWALVQAHRWPGNARELEMFVVQVLGRMDTAIIHGARLPEDLRARLLPRNDPSPAESFEDMARVRLAPVVATYEAASPESLHGLVVASVERVLIQLVLARTEGNRKAAAALLGVARNTLQARLAALGITASRG